MSQALLLSNFKQYLIITPQLCFKKYSLKKVVFAKYKHCTMHQHLQEPKYRRQRLT